MSPYPTNRDDSVPPKYKLKYKIKKNHRGCSLIVISTKFVTHSNTFEMKKTAVICLKILLGQLVIETTANFVTGFFFKSVNVSNFHHTLRQSLLDSQKGRHKKKKKNHHQVQMAFASQNPFGVQRRKGIHVKVIITK